METSNRFEMLNEDKSRPDELDTAYPPQGPKPPIHGVINYTDMIKSLTEVVEEQFFTKSLSNNVVKLACSTPDTQGNHKALQGAKHILPHIPTKEE